MPAKRLLVTIAGTLAIVLCALASVDAQQLYYLETSDLRLIYYAKAHEYLVKHTARCFENSFAFHRTLFRYDPSERVTVLLHDFSDYGNAGAGTVPTNHLSVGIAPYSYAYETTPANERMNATMNHEVVHIVAADKASSRDRFFRWLFSGKIRETDEHPETILYSFLTTPRRSAPRWYHEGIAVFFETWMAGGLGRSLGAWDEMYFRTLVVDKGRIFDPIGLESEATKVDFQIGVVSYLYGARFIGYLALTYSPEKVVDWVARENGSKAYFGAQFAKVFGLPMGKAWSQWIAWEEDFQRRNLDTVAVFPITPARPIPIHALGSVSRAFYDSTTRELYLAVNYPGQIAHIAAVNVTTGAMRKITDIKGASLFYVSSLAFDPSDHTLFYTTDNDEWRDLRCVDVRTGKSRLLMKDVRVGDLAFNQADRSLWGVRHFNGISSVVRIPHPYTEWNLMRAWPYGQDVYTLDVSPDGSLLSASLAEPSGRQTLITMDVPTLISGDSTFRTVYDFGNSIPGDFVFTPDGNHLIGASYYTGVSNIFRYNLKLDSMEVLSNARTGYFRPTPYTADSTIVLDYTSRGFQPVVIANVPINDVNPVSFLGQKIVDKHPVVKSWIAGSPGKVNIDSLTEKSGDYHPLSHLSVTSIYPIVQGYDDYAAFGLHTDISDPLGLYSIKLTGSYTPNRNLDKDERYHGRIEYDHGSLNLSATVNDADFYDLFGPTKSSRKGYSIGGKYEKSFFEDGPRSLSGTVTATYYGELDRLPAYQNIVSSFSEFFNVGASLGYKNRIASLGAVDYEKGYAWQLAADNKFVSGRTFPRFRAQANFGFPLPLHHSSLWLYGYAGHSPSERDEPLANFYFGGFGNNWVDHGSVERFRDYYAFPGIELNAAGGATFAKGMVEWKLPPLRFRRVGLPSLYATFAKLSLFATGLSTNFDREEIRENLGNLGTQLDIKLIMLSHLKLTFSAGYAVSFAKGRGPLDETMISVKVL